MNRLRPAVAALALLTLFAFEARPVRAQLSEQFHHAHMLKQGITSLTWAGPGVVVLQVEVFPDGSFKVIRVIRSSNHGDDAAALEIAKTSTYRPARRGTTPVQAFFDYTLKFGKSVVTSGNGGAGGGALGHINVLIAAGKYADAKAAATTYLASSPNDTLALQYLGVADFYANDSVGAVAAFDRVPTIGKPFRILAAHAYANAAVQQAATNPQQAESYAKRAYSLNADTNSEYALGVAQFAAKEYAQSIATLTSVKAALFALKTTPTESKVAVDTHLLQDYLQTGNAAQVQATVAELKSLDPSHDVAAPYLGTYYFDRGVAAAKAHEIGAALAAFDEAGASGDPHAAEAADIQAAFTIAQETTPNFKLLRSYVRKALAMDPKSPDALFAEGIGYAEEGLATHRSDLHDRAMQVLNQALELAKAAGRSSLVLQIQKYIKHLGV